MTKLTNRQAIGVLDGLWSNPLFGEAHRQAFEIGIKAIKALEQEPSDDAISRKDTLKAMIKQLGIKNEDYLIPAEATLYKVVKNMPPVVLQPKMGCEGCTYEKTGNNSTYPCSHCSRCYTDKYKSESEG